ncbi:FtsX-like permease family protein [Cellulomonas sp.]|uniref:FtsX-like permease family protein n=1 Tax=Cellulomonas sp. TaxID=40001 RepID=UPI00258B3772|nr:FtsX-like permease family protein [Cellulomonas sp.]MCR6690381.1 hypothetical protein [Cellulomonas sp.]
MSSLLVLAPRLTVAPGRDGRTPTVLAVAAFGLVTATAAGVLATALAFARRAAAPASPLEQDLGGAYALLACVALLALALPVVTLARGAARLAVVHREERISTLRMLGATPREVAALVVVEVLGRAALGGLIGAALYAALLPVGAGLPVQGGSLSMRELWVGPGVLAAVVAAVCAVAAVSAAVASRRVGLPEQEPAHRPARRRYRPARAAVALGAALGTFVVTTFLELFAAAAIAALLGCLLLASVAFDTAGPWLLAARARRDVRRAPCLPQLLAGRRLLDDPHAAWAGVRGVATASFVAGALVGVPAVATQDGDAHARVLTADLMTGALLALGVTFVLAAGSAAVTQAVELLERRRTLVLADRAGVPAAVLDAARRRAVLGPLLHASAGSAVLALVLLAPFFGTAALTRPGALAAIGGVVAGGGVLVAAATWTTRPLLRRVLAQDARPAVGGHR